MTVAAVPQKFEKKSKAWYKEHAVPNELAIAIVDKNIKAEDVKKKQKEQSKE